MKYFCQCPRKNIRAPRCGKCGFSTNKPRPKGVVRKRGSWRAIEKRRYEFVERDIALQTELKKKILQLVQEKREMEEKIAWETKRREEQEKGRVYSKRERYNFDVWSARAVKEIEDKLYECKQKYRLAYVYPHEGMTRVGVRIFSRLAKKIAESRFTEEEKLNNCLSI